jgi:hypothetical protein
MIVAFLGALVLIAGAAAYWLVIRQGRARSSHPTQPTKAGGRFGAVEIRTRSGACDSARTLEGQRFLAKDAPALPLPACAAAQCSCSFAKLSDRRTEGRRLSQGGLAASLFAATNRRAKRDRRRPAPARRS